jgi:hypothetical protein
MRSSWSRDQRVPSDIGHQTSNAAASVASFIQQQDSGAEEGPDTLRPMRASFSKYTRYGSRAQEYQDTASRYSEWQRSTTHVSNAAGMLQRVVPVEYNMNASPAAVKCAAAHSELCQLWCCGQLASTWHPPCNILPCCSASSCMSLSATTSAGAPPDGERMNAAFDDLLWAKRNRKMICALVTIVTLASVLCTAMLAGLMYVFTRTAPDMKVSRRCAGQALCRAGAVPASLSWIICRQLPARHADATILAQHSQLLGGWTTLAVMHGMPYTQRSLCGVMAVPGPGHPSNIVHSSAVQRCIHRAHAFPAIGIISHGMLGA